MMRSAADFETPNSGARCRKVRFLRQYVATSKTRSSKAGSTVVLYGPHPLLHGAAR